MHVVLLHSNGACRIIIIIINLKNTNIQTYIHTNVHKYIHTYLHTYTYINHTYIDAYIHTYIHRCIHTLLTYICTDVHTFIHYIHTHTHTHTELSPARAAVTRAPCCCSIYELHDTTEVANRKGCTSVATFKVVVYKYDIPRSMSI